MVNHQHVKQKKMREKAHEKKMQIAKARCAADEAVALDALGLSAARGLAQAVFNRLLCRLLFENALGKNAAWVQRRPMGQGTVQALQGECDAPADGRVGEAACAM